MQHDEIIWQVINNGFCSYKSKVARERTFCQNPYNVTGLCLRSACPLANSQYATIREEEGACYLFIKTIERAHSPKNLWEKIKLPANYTKALELVSTMLEHYPKYLVHRNKQRLTKIHQMLIRMRKLQLKERPKIETVNTKIEKREKGREKKALRAAQLDRAIEKELLDRLKEVSDGEIYNYSEKHFNHALKKAGKQQEREEEEEDEELEDEMEDAEWEGAEEEEDFENMSNDDEEDEEDDENEDDDEDEDDEALKKKKKGKGDSKSRAKPVHQGRRREEEDEEEEEEEDEEEEEAVKDYEVQYVEDFEESDDDIEDSRQATSSYYSKSSAAVAAAKRKAAPKYNAGGKRRKGARVEIEYEHETEPVSRATSRDMDFNF